MERYEALECLPELFTAVTGRAVVSCDPPPLLPLRDPLPDRILALDDCAYLVEYLSYLGKLKTALPALRRYIDSSKRPLLPLVRTDKPMGCQGLARHRRFVAYGARRCAEPELCVSCPSSPDG